MELNELCGRELKLTTTKCSIIIHDKSENFNSEIESLKKDRK